MRPWHLRGLTTGSEWQETEDTIKRTILQLLLKLNGEGTQKPQVIPERASFIYVANLSQVSQLSHQVYLTVICARVQANEKWSVFPSLSACKLV